MNLEAWKDAWQQLGSVNGLKTNSINWQLLLKSDQQLKEVMSSHQGVKTQL